MRSKKALGTIMAAMLVFSLLTIPVLATEPTAEEQRQEVVGQVNQLQEELSNIMIEVDELENQLITTGEQIIQTEADLVIAEEDKEQQFEAMKLRIRHIYETGTASTLERILSAESIGEALALVEHVQAVHNHDREMLTVFVETVATIDDLKASLEYDSIVLENTMDEYKEVAEVLRVTIEEGHAEIAYLDAIILEAARIAAEQARIAEEQRLAEEQAALEAEEVPLETEDATSEQEEVQPPSPPPEEDSPSPTPPADEFVPPEGNHTAAEIIVAAAHNALGIPYVWGGSTTAGFDCSGLTMWAHAQAGISIPRTSITQLHAGRAVPMGQQMPGDIAWTPGHVAIYIGGGLMIEAQQPGTNVLIAPVRVSQFVRFW
jgi:cell wall-associated NlpC family hydrolase